MRYKEQSDFFNGLNGSHKSEPMNYRYDPPIDRRINDYQRPAATDAAVGYGERYAKPGEVYIMLGILRGFRVKAKIGLSGDHEERLKYLKKDFGQLIVPVFVIRASNMIRLEKAAHKRFKPYNEPEATGSGRTEWFRINPIRLVKMIWFLYMKEQQFACGVRIESFKNSLSFRRNRL